MRILIQLVLFCFIILALGYITVKMGYLEVTEKGVGALETVLSDSLIAVKNFIAGIFRRVADMLQSSTT